MARRTKIAPFHLINIKDYKGKEEIIEQTGISFSEETNPPNIVNSTRLPSIAYLLHRIVEQL
jgi:hypothetical protein